MKKIVFTIIGLVTRLIVAGQEIKKDTTGCDLLKDIHFKNGIDTIEFTVLYRSSVPGNQEFLLKLLVVKKQILLDEYLDKNYESSVLEFVPMSCDKRYQATLSRKIYDRTYINKVNNIKDYRQGYVNLDDLTTYQKIRLKCIVFEQKEARNKHGAYCFTIIDLVPN